MESSCGVVPLRFEETNKCRFCIKCKNENGEPSLYIRRDDPPLCRTCFLTACVHKFRSAFGKNNTIRNGEHVLLAYSGGPSSTAMLHLARMCCESSETRRVRFQPEVISILDEAQRNNEVLVNSLNESGFKYQIFPPDQLSVDECSHVNHPASSNSLLTSDEDIAHWRRNLHLSSLARSLNTKYILVGDSASRLAAHCLSGITLGRGGHIASELQFLDDRYGDVIFLRPMKDFLSNEIALFLHFSGLDCVRFPTSTLRRILSRGPTVNSIQRLTENFISSLQFAGFPSTTKAILSAASKTLVETDDSASKCTLCFAPLPTPFSENVSLTAPDFLQYATFFCRKTESPGVNSRDSPPPMDLLCHSCLMNQNETLPSRIKNINI